MSRNIFMLMAFPERGYDEFVMRINRHMDMAFKKMKDRKYSVAHCYYYDCVFFLETYIRADSCNDVQTEELSKLLSRAKALHEESGRYMRGEL